MKVYQGISGAIYEVADKRLGRGGEGSVHKIENYPEHSKKISVIRLEKKNYARW